MRTEMALPLHGLKSTLVGVAGVFALALGLQTTQATTAANFTIVNHATSQPLSWLDSLDGILAARTGLFRRNLTRPSFGGLEVY